MWWSRGLALFLLLVLTGCGFRLQGSVDLPADVQAVYIDTADRYSPFYRQLREVIDDSDARLVSSAVNADTVIRVLKDDTGQRVLSVSARNVPVEYNVFYTLRYSVMHNGAQAVAPRDHALTRSYTYDAEAVLGKSAEEETLRNAMATELVRLVTVQLSSL